MNKMIRSLALVLVMVMCIGMLTACSGGSDETQDTTPSTTPSTAPSVTLQPTQDILGIVTEASDSFVKLELYVFDGEINYEALELDALTLSGETDYVYISSSASYSYISEGELKTLKDYTLEVGNIVEVVETAKGNQQFVILNYAAEGEATEPTTGTETE